VTFGGCGAGRLEEDAGIVDHSVHPADLVHLTGEVPGLGCAAEVADDHSRRVRGEVAERRRPLAAARVEDNVMALTDEGTGGGPAESVGGAGDEDSGHGIILPPVVYWHQSAAPGTWHPDPEGRIVPDLTVMNIALPSAQRARISRRWTGSKYDASSSSGSSLIPSGS